MKISELAAATQVSVPTLKYYLREGLLAPGTSLSRTQASYDESHVQRVTLVRALLESGGLSIAATKRVLATIDSPDSERLDVLANAQRALMGVDAMDHSPTPPTPPTRSRAREWVRARGWRVEEDDPIVGQLESRWAAAEVAGLGLDEELMNRYADAAEQIAEVDVSTVPPQPAAAVRQVVLGTVLIDPVLASLRRLAQQHVSQGVPRGRR